MKTPWGMTDNRIQRALRARAWRPRPKGCIYLRLAMLLDWEWWLGRVTFKDYLALVGDTPAWPPRRPWRNSRRN